jgi:hypothetical protein
MSRTPLRGKPLARNIVLVVLVAIAPLPLLCAAHIHPLIDLLIFTGLATCSTSVVCLKVRPRAVKVRIPKK